MHKILFTFVNLIILFWPFSLGHFNLFLTYKEVQRILGLKAELYYVREGVMNDYALGWTVPIPANVHHLYFQWEAVIKKPVLYNMAIVTTKNDPTKNLKPALFEPSVNVSLAGNLPVAPATFMLSLPCTGYVNAEVDVTLNINVTAPRPHLKPTVLFLKRRKICMEGVAGGNFEPHSDPKEKSGNSNYDVIYWVVPIVVGTILVFVTVLAIAVIRRKRRRSGDAIKPLGMDSTTTSGLSTKERLRSGSSFFTPTGVDIFKTPSTPNNNFYTLPSSVTVNSYASIHKAPVHYFTPNLSMYSRVDSPVNTYTYARPLGSEASIDSQTSFEESSSNGVEDSQEEAKLFRPFNEEPLKSFRLFDEETKYFSPFDEEIKSCRPFGEDSTFRHNMNGSLNTFGSTRKSGRSSLVSKEIVVDPKTTDFREKFKMLQIERERVRITAVIHEGKLGRILRGWVQAEHPKKDQQVVIKTLREGVSIEEESQLCREGARLFNFLHQNILSLLGVSFSDNVSTFLIYADHGSVNLKLFLRDRQEKGLKTQEIVDLAAQAATGLQYLHGSNVLHADIAARNCLIDDRYRLRLTDAALGSDIFPADYDVLHIREAAKPVKWMAYELLTDKLMSTASDVWSYGILVWELLTAAQQPYEDIQPKEMSNYLREGYRLTQPRNCPDDLYQLLAFCWASVPYDRPRVEAILTYLKSFEKKLKTFV